MTRKKQIAEAYFTLLQAKVETMYNKDSFDLFQLRRTVRKFCKTTQVGNHCFTLHIKKSDIGVNCTIHEVSGELTRISIKNNNRRIESHFIYVKNNKEFLEKLIKHGYFGNN